jgi:hypothetical protein
LLRVAAGIVHALHHIPTWIGTLQPLQLGTEGLNARLAMPYFEFLWTEEIIAHLAEHGIGTKEFEEVVSNPDRRGVSRSSGRPCCWGETADGRQLFCVYEFLERFTVGSLTGL